MNLSNINFVIDDEVVKISFVAKKVLLITINVINSTFFIMEYKGSVKNESYYFK
ncbi:hypothetical protein ACT7CT_21220 [Bacillus sanguinis]